MPSALPVVSVDTVEEAKAIQARFCRLQYNGRYVWTDFPIHDVDALPGIADQIMEFLKKLKGRKP